MHFLQCSKRILFDVTSVISVIIAVEGVIHGINDMIFLIPIVKEVSI